ncbi:MAG: AMP-binding protein [Burkholderiaceae bacterium]
MNHLLTISDAIATHARLNPEKTGARDSRRALTFAQWDDRATKLARALLATGLQPGDRVAVLATNCLEWMEIYVGLARAALVAVPINFRLAANEIHYIVKDSEAAAIIAGAGFRTVIDGLRERFTIGPGRYLLIDDSRFDGWVAYETLFCAVLPKPGMVNTLPAVSPEQTCALMYTSGTTGRPKGAIRNHAGSTLIALATALEMGFTRDDTALLVMPLCHANSLYFGNTFMHLGATIVIDDHPSFDPEALLAALSEHGVTFTSLVPTHFTMVLALPEAVRARYNVSRVGRLMISSAPARENLKIAILNYFNNGKLYELYGSTEAGWVTLLRPDEQLDKLGSVGREWSGSGAIRLFDEHGNEVADGQIGELYSRTSYVFDGYWKNPEKTAESFRGQWCSVGDMARRDADGYIWLVDRKSNMIISGGENIYPSEVEAVLSKHEIVRDVAVIGVPDDKWGESVLAVVSLHSEKNSKGEWENPASDALAAQLTAWCREHLSGYKCPRRVVFVNEDEMPRTATGKIQHRLLRERVLSRVFPN